MGQAQHFEQGQNWRAKNTASVRLRSSDGRKHAVALRQVPVSLTDEQIAAAERTRAIARARAEAQLEAEKARRQATARKQQAVRKRAEQELLEQRRNAKGNPSRKLSSQSRNTQKDKAPGNTPEGWVPANRRSDYKDPMARANDPRRLGPNLPKTAKQKRRVIRPGN